MTKLRAAECREFIKAVVEKAEAMRVPPLIAEAIAQPTAWGYCVARLPLIVKKLFSRQEYMIGSWRPFSLSARFE